jgi:hypothetical protein
VLLTDLVNSQVQFYSTGSETLIACVPLYNVSLTLCPLQSNKLKYTDLT